VETINKFASRLTPEWLIPFCQARSYTHDGFDEQGIKRLSPTDASDFMEAVDTGLVSHQNGTFSAPLSKAKEQIFWQGPRDSVPRKVTLWLEPIITIAALRRLQRDFLWPMNQLGLQSKTWAFDLVAYSDDLITESLTCEVKKTEREVDALIECMIRHLNTPLDAAVEFKGSERNAFMKILALRKSACSVFWVLGPGRYGYIFNVVHEENGEISLQVATESALRAPLPSGLSRRMH
jgi:hypothetical protein